MIKTANTHKALSLLQEVTTNEILFFSKNEFEEKFRTKFTGNGAHFFFNNKHHICINENMSDLAKECTYVHECLHALLRIEGYPCCYLEGRRVFRDKEKNSLLHIAGSITDAMHHPQIYQRMKKDFDLNLELYFKNLLIAKIDRLESMPRSEDNFSAVYRSQQNFIDAIEYFYYPLDIKSKIFEKIKEILPDNYNFLINLKPKKIKFDTPKNSKSTMDDLLNRIKAYGKKRNAEILNERVWNLMIIK